MSIFCLKSHSSKWIKTKGEGYENFYWQNGYGAFSVNPREVDKVIHYIANQHAHHSKQGFQDEYRAFLKQYNVKYDEKYVWDWLKYPIALTIITPSVKSRFQALDLKNGFFILKKNRT